MQILSRLIFLICVILVASVPVSYLGRDKPSHEKPTPALQSNLAQMANELEPDDGTAKRRAATVVALQKFCEENDYNTTRCFMIDMSIHSGKNRFFVYNFKTDSVEYAGLVTHGSGSISATGQLKFSNVPGSGSTSLGKYKIGNAYQGRFGLAYKLHGLDDTNNKAFERFVVLHGHSCVPEVEVYPLDICPSLGCPTVSPAFLQTIKLYLDKTNKPILLTIYQ